ncbi:MAG TPA: DUF6492 family protein [Thermomicrobiales bacterium]|jgi:hypothetical protein
MDVFICVHERDLGPLFEIVLDSYARHFQPKGRLTLVSNNVPQLRSFLNRTGLAGDAILLGDDEILSPHERTLPGWYRQQVIKLRAAEFTTSEHFCNLGADAVLLQTVTEDDLISGDNPILYYSKGTTMRDYLLGLPHLRYERARVDNVGRILHVEPRRAMRYGDFILDLFCFNRRYMEQLHHYLEQLYGPEPLYQILRELGDGRADSGFRKGQWSQNRFGEWTLYSVFLLDALGAPVITRNAARGYFEQVHSRRALRYARFEAKIVHLVARDLDFSSVLARLAARDPGLLNAPAGDRSVSIPTGHATPRAMPVVGAGRS